MKKLTFLLVISVSACGNPESISSGSESAQYRPPAVSGMFYPSDSTVLHNYVDSLLAAVPTPDIDQSTIISGVVPHAGYVYSGYTAAAFFKTIEGMSFDIVYIIAPTHTTAFQGFSVFSGDGYLTPLGLVDVNREASERLISTHPSASFIPSVHVEEHAIEVELPFLQRSLEPGFSIVPVVVGYVSSDELRYLAELMLAEAYSSDILIIASSDLSHYPPQDLAEEIDSVTVESFLSGDTENFLSTTLPEDAPPEVATYACGRLPMAAVLFYNSLFPGSETYLLGYATSADAGGDPSGVVGYASIVTATPQFDPQLWSLSNQTRTELLEIAKNSVSSAVSGQGGMIPEFLKGSELALPRGVFITLRENGALRGCIGTLRPVYPLAEAVARMAASAALDDPRFRPVTSDELNLLEYEISVLTPLQIMQNWEDVRLGTDGLYIIKNGCSGVLLPQVPQEMNWNRDEFLTGLCRKAGLPDDAYLNDAILYRFQAEIIHMLEYDVEY